MSTLYVARRKVRRGLLLSMSGNRTDPNLLFPLDGVDRSELDELIRAILAKQGVTNESEIQAIVEKAEQAAEVRQKVHEARMEIRRLMALKANGAKLIATGFRRWKEAFFRPIAAKP